MEDPGPPPPSLTFRGNRIVGLRFRGLRHEAAGRLRLPQGGVLRVMPLSLLRLGEGDAVRIVEIFGARFSVACFDAYCPARSYSASGRFGS